MATEYFLSRWKGYEAYPAFALGQPRFPQDSFTGRYLHFKDIIDWKTLFATKKDHTQAFNLLDRWKSGERGFATDEEMWKAQKLKQSTFHPDTGEKIFPAFRMAGYVPFGWITVTGLLLRAPSTATMIFWQWANQSHNAAVNYANRNASQPQPISRYVYAYCAAVGAACSVSFGLNFILKRFKDLPKNTQFIFQRFIPLPATSLASSLNVLCMRGSEVATGIDVYDRDGNVVGVSQVAAKQALKETTLTRAFLPVPLLLLPQLILPKLEKISSIAKCDRRLLLLQSAVCTASFALSLPVALALFPQESTIATSQLEEHIRSKTKKDVLFFNKGL
ncbi:hypothetical protein PENTCL1PPCAC_8442 [Pristionchus entomophagus]|uniref:Sidoreflexin n=1 Tax=Pristionchus entomophagus TaxID=358040 RepID=A0AAV5SV25_9BILA|nr:hypothetical protein PENTCL1PPCAC_8442 [Pristionchus entomophagus]